MTLCQLDATACARIGPYANAYRDSLADHAIPLLPDLIEEPESACVVRNEPKYGLTVTVAQNSALLAIQTHEMGHGLLGHLGPDAGSIGPKQEAHADAVARYFLELSDPTDEIDANWGALGYLPLLRKDFDSDVHPNLACRVFYLSGEQINFRNADTDCTAYEKDVAEGAQLIRKILGDDADLLIDEP